MANPNAQRDALRIPNLPAGKIVDPDGMPTADELQFRQTLLTLLESILGNEGLVMPSQSTTNIAIIQTHVQDVQQGSATNTINTCQFGTMIYDTTLGVAKIALEYPLGSGTPVFHTITTS
jgi:hypothetical protein